MIDCRSAQRQHDVPHDGNEGYPIPEGDHVGAALQAHRREHDRGESAYQAETGADSEPSEGGIDDVAVVGKDAAAGVAADQVLVEKTDGETADGEDDVADAIQANPEGVAEDDGGDEDCDNKEEKSGVKDG